MKSYLIKDADRGKRADVFIAERYPEFTRAALKKLFEGGLITVNSKTLKAGYKLSIGDSVDVNESPLTQKPGDISLPIIYEDSDIVVIDKPAGVLSHSKGGFNNEPTVASFVSKLYHFEPGEAPTNRSGIVHRLDRDTSGVMIAAKNLSAQLWLQRQFSQRKVKKTYIAVVEGEPSPSEAIIDVPIARNPKKPQTFAVLSNGRPAQTHYKVLSGAGKLSVVELKPASGRTHQLRVHLAYINHPIVGDRIYGHGDTRLYLHAQSLELTLPSKQRQVFVAPLPAEFTHRTQPNG